MKKVLSIASAGVLLLQTGCGSHGPASQTTAPAIPSNAIIIDVRTPEEFNAGHIQGATNVPVDTIESRIEEVVPNKNTPLAVHCQSGRRSKIAADALKRNGYQVQDLGSYANARSVLNPASE